MRPNTKTGRLLTALLFTVAFLTFGSATVEDFTLLYAPKLAELAGRLEERGVPSYWFWNQIARETFRFHENIESSFHDMIEHRYSRGEIELSDYKQHFNVVRRAELGKTFVNEHRELLLRVEDRNGIDFELIVAILGIETNYARMRNRGNYYVFDALVSQYLLIPRRENFALNQLSALYIFIQRTGRDTDYFVGSYAGASGWGQFIPTSLNSFFISADGIDENIDIFSIEDTVFSIENYLNNHGLRRETMNSERHIRNAVFAYNRSNAYVEAVLFIYESLRSLRD